MNRAECVKLLKEIAAVDNRQISQDTVDAWHKIIGVVPYDIAQQALHLARADERIQYLEPKHIIAKSKVAAEEMDRQERINNPQVQQDKGVPCPRCIHEECITFCKECNKRLAAYHKTHSDTPYSVCGCYEFAKKELIA